MSSSSYSDQEIADILKRAAELQAAAERTADVRPGLTLKELEGVAADAGLDPQFVRQAAQEQRGAARPSLRRASAKSRTHVFAERHVAGTLTEESWEDTVLELRHRFDTDWSGAAWGTPEYGRGRTEQFGRAREWRHTAISGVETRLVVRPRDEAVDLHLSQRVGFGSPTAEGIGYGGILAGIIGVLIGIAASSEPIGLAAFLIAWILAAPIIRHLDLVWRAKKHAELEELADTAARLAVVPAAPASEAHASDATGVRAAREDTTPSVSLDGLGEEVPEREGRSGEGRTRTR